jgi:hypothetical protein
MKNYHTTRSLWNKTVKMIILLRKNSFLIIVQLKSLNRIKKYFFINIFDKIIIIINANVCCYINTDKKFLFFFSFDKIKRQQIFWEL